MVAIVTSPLGFSRGKRRTQTHKKAVSLSGHGLFCCGDGSTFAASLSPQILAHSCARKATPGRSGMLAASCRNPPHTRRRGRRQSQTHTPRAPAPFPRAPAKRAFATKNQVAWEVCAAVGAGCVCHKDYVAWEVCTAVSAVCVCHKESGGVGGLRGSECCVRLPQRLCGVGGLHGSGRSVRLPQRLCGVGGLRGSGRSVRLPQRIRWRGRFARQ